MQLRQGLKAQARVETELLDECSEGIWMEVPGEVGQGLLLSVKAY